MKGKRAGAVMTRALTCARAGGTKPGSRGGGGAGAMTSRSRRRRATRGSGSYGRGGGSSPTCDFRAALGRDAVLGWGGPEATLWGPAALSVSPARPRPSPNQSSDRVGKVTPSLSPGFRPLCGVGPLDAATCWPRDFGRGLLWSGPWDPVRLLRLQTRWSRPLPALTCFILSLTRARPESFRPTSACGDFGLAVAPLSLPPELR